MTTLASFPVTIQTSAQSVPSMPSWFGEVTIIAHYLKRLGVLDAVKERVRFARRRFGKSRRDRLCGCSHWLCPQWRTNSASLL